MLSFEENIGKVIWGKGQCVDSSRIYLCMQHESIRRKMIQGQPVKSQRTEPGTPLLTLVIMISQMTGMHNLKNANCPPAMCCALKSLVEELPVSTAMAVMLYKADYSPWAKPIKWFFFKGDCNHSYGVK